MSRLTLPHINWRNVFIGFGLLAIGVLIGGYLFADSQPRSILEVHPCQHQCLSPNQLIGLVGSVVIQRTPQLLQPAVLVETDKTVAIKNPQPESAVDYVVIPKKDIRDIGDLSPDDQAYLVDAYAVIDKLIRDNHLTNYAVYTYGTGRQTVAYLHFHVVSPSLH